MLDLALLRRIGLSANPIVQRVVATTMLFPNYDLPPRLEVVFENEERVPNEPVILAMNHTDRYNYWPLQYKWWQRKGRFTATWVKGKYYENAFVGKFLELNNSIPTVSRGYIITKDVVSVLGRRPESEEYRRLRALCEAAGRGEDVDDAGVPDALRTTPRIILGRAFDPNRETWPQAMEALYREMMGEFLRLNQLAMDIGNDLLIFPQGTRSKRLSKGHGGIAQIAFHLGATVVPIGCNGTDKVYPSGNPLAKPGRVVYRFGHPITMADVADLRPSEPFTPFTAEAEQTHGATFQRYADRLMDAINPLLDEEYQFGDDQESEGVRGSHRFV